MKKLFLFLAIALMPLIVTAAGPGKKAGKADSAPSEVLSLISQYSLKDGFQIVKVGSFGMSLAKPFLRMAMDSTDPDDKMVLDLISGVKKLALVSYEGCSTEVREKFDSKLDRILSEDNLLMNLSDGNEKLKIYGFISDDGSTMTDFVLHTPSESALICLFGTISLDALVALAAN